MATGQLQGPLVDSHAHIWEPDMPYAATAWTRPDYVYTAEQFLADMASAGIRFGVVAAASLFGTYNDYTIRSLRKYRNLRGTAIVDPTVDLYTLEAMRADGIVGVRLQWFMLDSLPDMASETFQRFCRRVRDVDMHVHLNIEGHRMPAVAQQLIGTGVKLVIDHYGWHDPTLRLRAQSYQDMLRLMECPDVWIKLASGFRRPDRDLPAQYTQDLLARFGAERLLWGSDSPFVGHEHAATYRSVVADLHYAVPDERTRQALGESAYRFYFS